MESHSALLMCFNYYITIIDKNGANYNHTSKMWPFTILFIWIHNTNRITDTLPHPPNIGKQNIGNYKYLEQKLRSSDCCMRKEVERHVFP